MEPTFSLAKPQSILCVKTRKLCIKGTISMTRNRVPLCITIRISHWHVRRLCYSIGYLRFEDIRSRIKSRVGTVWHFHWSPKQPSIVTEDGAKSVSPVVAFSKSSKTFAYLLYNRLKGQQHKDLNCICYTPESDPRSRKASCCPSLWNNNSFGVLHTLQLVLETGMSSGRSYSIQGPISVHFGTTKQLILRSILTVLDHERVTVVKGQVCLESSAQQRQSWGKFMHTSMVISKAAHNIITLLCLWQAKQQQHTAR